MRKRLLLCFVSLVIALSVCAQDNRGKGFSPEKFQADLEQFIIKEAGLTNKEAKSNTGCIGTCLLSNRFNTCRTGTGFSYIRIAISVI